MLITMQTADGQAIEVDVVRVAIIKKSTMTVDNTIVLPSGWPDVVAWAPPKGYLAAATDVGNVGDTYNSDTNEFTPAEAPAA